MIADWLRRDLGPQSGIVLNREVRATRLGRLDIKVEAAARATASFPLVVPVEIKGDWNPGVTTALGTQLVGSYLQANQWTHGVYVVGWFGGRKLRGWRPANHEEAADCAARWVETQVPDSLTVRAVILDCARANTRETTH